MSLRLMGLAMGRELGRGKQATEQVRMAVILALADRASDDGGGIWASASTLAKLARCTERSVRRCLADFESEKLIKREGTRRCRSGATVVWRIDVERLKRRPLLLAERGQNASDEEEAGLSVTPSHDCQSPQGVTESPTNLSLEPTLEPKNAMSNDMAMPSGIAACSASPIELEQQLGCTLAEAVNIIIEDFEDVLSPKLTLSEWAADLAELLQDFALCEIQDGARAWFQTHRRRKARDGIWEPLRRPLRHPKVRMAIAYAANRSTGPSSPRQYGRTGARGSISLTTNGFLSDAKCDGEAASDFLLRDEATLAIWGPL